MLNLKDFVDFIYLFASVFFNANRVIAQHAPNCVENYSVEIVTYHEIGVILNLESCQVTIRKPESFVCLSIYTYITILSVTSIIALKTVSLSTNRLMLFS